MELEKQVCSLELAKELRELGVKQESLWIWDEVSGIDNKLHLGIFLSGGKEGIAPAYTVAELYSLLYSCGICDILIKVEPGLLADHLANILCTKLENK